MNIENPVLNQANKILIFFTSPTSGSCFSEFRRWIWLGSDLKWPHTSVLSIPHAFMSLGSLGIVGHIFVYCPPSWPFLNIFRKYIPSTKSPQMFSSFGGLTAVLCRLEWLSRKSTFFALPEGLTDLIIISLVGFGWWWLVVCGNRDAERSN